MNTDLIITSAEILLIVAFIAWRQFSPRRITTAMTRVPLVLAVVGLYQVSQVAYAARLGAGAWLGVLLGVACAALIAIPRGASIRVWRTADGTWMRRGGWATAGWWSLALALRAALAVLLMPLLGAPAAGGAFTGATALLYVGVSLGVQALVVGRRVRAAGGTGSGSGSYRGRGQLRPVAVAGPQDVLHGQARWWPRPGTPPTLSPVWPAPDGRPACPRPAASTAGSRRVSFGRPLTSWRTARAGTAGPPPSARRGCRA